MADSPRSEIRPPDSQNSLPRQAANLVQNSSHLAGATRVASSLGDSPVGAHSSSRDLANSVGDGRDEGRFRGALKVHDHVKIHL